MAEIKDSNSHIVEIPVEQERQEKMLVYTMPMEMSFMSTAIQDHPLTEISESPGHLLLLKLWQREEELFGRRIALKQTRMDSVRQELFQLCAFLFIFHGFFLTLLFSSSARWQLEDHPTCKKWWITAIISLATSLVFVFLVHAKVCRFWKVSRQLQRERNDSRALSRCIQELRMKGASFDLSKEPRSGKRMKSSSVEIKWKPLTWGSQNLLTLCLVCLTGLAFPASKLILCWL